MGFTRQSVKDIEYNGATIPAGTPFFMNAYAANYDDTHFKSPTQFIPERFLDIPDGAGTVHYGYGAGARSCSGMHLANRELYAIFSRLILAFHIRPTSDLSARPILDAIECNSVMTSMVTQPKPFKVGYVPRDRGMVEKWVYESLERTRYL
jgi:phenylacetate 2-hydroxylase